MAEQFERRTCEYCRKQSEILPPEDFLKAGWRKTLDLEGWFDICPECRAKRAIEDYEQDEATTPYWPESVAE